MTTPIRIHTEDPRLGRRINHDPRSKRYPVDVAGLDVTDVEWPYYLPVLDQGQIGKCTAEAAVEMLGSDPFRQTLEIDIVNQLATDEYTNQFYSDEETLDGDGPYPPNDNGSDGLTSAKIAQARGLISGYTHAFSAEDALKGMQNGPGSWGTLWKTGMDAVDETTGQIRYTGSVRGGHELCVYKINALEEQLWFHQSWGAWGYQRSGIAWISFADFEVSLADQGDVTFFVPRTKPAPLPTPPPAPASDIMISWPAGDVSFMDEWALARHSRTNRTAALTWLRGARA